MRTPEAIEREILNYEKRIADLSKTMSFHRHYIEVTRGLIAALRAELAEAQKPKLKHGDICQSLHTPTKGQLRVVAGGKIYVESGYYIGVSPINDASYSPLANIFELMEQGPILIPMSLVDAGYIARDCGDCGWCRDEMRRAQKKVRAALQAYRNATA